MTFDSKCASQYLCFDVTPPFSSIMTRSPSTTLHRVFPQLFLTPPQPFGFTPHLSSHLLLTPRSSALLPALCPPNPQTPSFPRSVTVHASRATRSNHHAAPRSNLAAALQGFSAQWGCVTTRLGRRQRYSYFGAQGVHYPNFTGQKGRASLI
jgi:hypothetical protein